MTTTDPMTTTTRRIKHRDWVIAATKSLQECTALLAGGKLPDSIEVFMVLAPAKRVLRGIYGNDLNAAWFLLWQALIEWIESLPWRIRIFWRYTVMREDREADVDRMIKELEADLYDENGI